jgi:carbonic anhydrase
MEPATYPQPPDQALAALMDGNQRYLEGDRRLLSHSPLGDRHAEGQRPFAAIIACADSRVSPALIFDLDRGNLFVSRIAANSIDTGTLGSTEYAVAELEVRLVMVLGHSDCGAVNAAIGVVDGNAEYPPGQYGAIGAVVDAVVPSVRSLPGDQRTLANCVEANALAQARELADKGPIIRPALEAGTLRVVAAVCDVESGGVELLPRSR